MWYYLDENDMKGVVSVADLSFSGNFAHSIDPKGRVTIPMAFREALGGGFTIGLNNQSTALALYPKAMWAEKCAQLRRIPDTDVRGMKYRRWVMGNSFPDMELDSQGRVLLPQTLRAQIGISKAIRFVGMDSYLEIWDEDRYLAEYDLTQSSFEDLMNYVDERYFRSGDA